jgi:hypothetical protein
MKKTQNTRGYKRYFAIDTHREYHLVGAQNEDRQWVVTPRRVSIEKFPEWAKLNFREWGHCGSGNHDQRVGDV